MNESMALKTLREYVLYENVVNLVRTKLSIKSGVVRRRLSILTSMWVEALRAMPMQDTTHRIRKNLNCIPLFNIGNAHDVKAFCLYPRFWDMHIAVVKAEEVCRTMAEALTDS